MKRESRDLILFPVTLVSTIQIPFTHQHYCACVCGCVNTCTDSTKFKSQVRMMQRLLGEINSAVHLACFTILNLLLIKTCSPPQKKKTCSPFASPGLPLGCPWTLGLITLTQILPLSQWALCLDPRCFSRHLAHSFSSQTSMECHSLASASGYNHNPWTNPFCREQLFWKCC